ncbi:MULTISPECIES: hypothetical protein [Aerosakkonema]|uniref:hypothetical protein n=1 Tax=Aerosakkonema TaxID=1246629 RepID=UPI0035BC28AE
MNRETLLFLTFNNRAKKIGYAASEMINKSLNILFTERFAVNFGKKITDLAPIVSSLFLR